MTIKETSLNLVYPRVSEYRKKFINSEDALGDYFMQPLILPVPDEVQDEVPRIVVQTKNAHSVLNIALSVASFTTNYDGEFVRDWDKCKNYLEQRCSSMYDIINGMTENSNIYVGLITTIEMDNLNGTGLEILKKGLFDGKADKMGELYDLSCKLTYVYKKKYYINITMENMREFLEQQYDNGKICIIGEKKHMVSVMIDVNDKYAANNNKDYKSEKRAFDEVLQITNNIINNKLEDLVKKGEFVYDE